MFDTVSWRAEGVPGPVDYVRVLADEDVVGVEVGVQQLIADQ